MRKKLFVFLIALSPVLIYAQEKISLNFAQVFSGFRFKDSQGNEDEYLSRDIKYSYAVNYEKVFSPGFYIKPEIGYKNFGAKSNVDNTKIDWNLHYLDFNVGGGFLYKQHKIKPYIGAAFYFAYMYKGDQTVGSDSYDLLKLKALSTTDYGIDLNLGVRYDFSESSSVFIEYRQIFGLCQLDKNLNGGSKELYNKASSIHFGLAFSIIKEEPRKSMLD